MCKYSEQSDRNYISKHEATFDFTAPDLSESDQWQTYTNGNVVASEVSTIPPIFAPNLLNVGFMKTYVKGRHPKSFKSESASR